MTNARRWRPRWPTRHFSLPSLLLIVIYIAGLVLGPKAASGQIESRLSGAMGPVAAAQIQTMVTAVAQNRTGGLVATAFGVRRFDTLGNQRPAATSAMSQQGVESKSGRFGSEAFRDEPLSLDFIADRYRHPRDGVSGRELRDLGVGDQAALP